MEYKIKDNTGRSHLDGFRIQYFLVRQWMHVYVSLRRLVQKTADSPQLQFTFGRRRPPRTAVVDFHGPVYSADHRDSAVAVRIRGRCLRCAGRAVSQVSPWRRHSCSHSCSSLRHCRPWFRLRKTARFPQLQVHQGRSYSCRGAEADPHVLVTMEISQLQFDMVSSSLLCRLCSSTGAGCGGDSRDPLVVSCSSPRVVDIRVVTQRQFPLAPEILQLQFFDMVFDVPVVRLHRSGRCSACCR